MSKKKFPEGDTPGSRLRYLRKTAGMLQTDMGQAIYATPFTISNLETGKARITKSKAQQICAVFNCRYEWFVDGEGPIRDVPEDEPGSRLLGQAGTLNDSRDRRVRAVDALMDLMTEEEQRELMAKAYEIMDRQKEDGADEEEAQS